MIIEHFYFEKFSVLYYNNNTKYKVHTFTALNFLLITWRKAGISDRDPILEEIMYCKRHLTQI
jgi:hypothetical protein